MELMWGLSPAEWMGRTYQGLGAYGHGGQYYWIFPVDQPNPNSEWRLVLNPDSDDAEDVGLFPDKISVQLYAEDHNVGRTT
jgi:hypothetical protein